MAERNDAKKVKTCSLDQSSIIADVRHVAVLAVYIVATA